MALIRLVLASVLAASAAGQSRLVCPVPMSATVGDVSLEAPCGSSDTRQYTIVSPGLLTIKYEEIAYLKGSPTVFRLFKRTDFSKSCLLLDHVPHADSWPSEGGCRPGHLDQFPVGTCPNSTAYVTINIPDVDCQDCVLQIMTVSTASLPADQKCRTNGVSASCTAHYSCANIQIRGTHSSLDVCGRYNDNLPGFWPYSNLTEGVYSNGEGTTEYTSAGWLGIIYFSGSLRDSAPFVTPWGPCVPPVKRFGAIIDLPGLVGVFSAAINGDHLVVSGMLSEQMRSVSFGIPGGLYIFTSFIRNNSIFGTAVLPYNFQKFVFSGVSLQLMNGTFVSAPFKPAIWTVSLRDGSSHYGEVVYGIDGERSVILGNLQGRDVRSLTVDGPGRAPSPSAVLDRLDPLLQRRGDALWLSGAWDPLSGSTKLATTEARYPTSVYFWLERARLSLALSASSSAGNATIRQRVPRPSDCQLPADVRCLGSVFSIRKVSGGGNYADDSGGPAVAVFGVGAVVLDGGQNVFTLALENVREGEQPVAVKIQGVDTGFERIPTEKDGDVAIVAGAFPRNLAMNLDVEFTISTNVASTYKGVLSLGSGISSDSPSTTAVTNADAVRGSSTSAHTSSTANTRVAVWTLAALSMVAAGTTPFS